GDEVIRQVARVTRQMARDTDYAGRYGGEEFVVLLPNTSLDGAAQFAERLRSSVEQLRMAHEQSSLQCSVSIGVACIRADMADHQALIEAADKALYQAKWAGRNKVVASPATEA